ncbi:excisionase [Cedecea davisae]|uniref:Excisionase n=1 Tax=Cedecea davisae TaxID=158484 RepID=A0ABS6DH74_9ENTR|nr:excisionase [Cedecea davisae]MBU4682550.1 excisionase [Cedecea davisae]MBU4687620.1 excisionase [Cedecea davisae]
MDKKILVTRDLTEHYHISRKTLWKWQNHETMPKGFARPFPSPDFPGNPNRWKLSSVKEWEDRSREH